MIEIQNLNSSEEQANLHIVEKLFFVGMTNGKITALYKKLSMECIKKLHETVEILEILEILWAKCLNCLKNLNANFYSVCCPAYHAASDFVFCVGILFRHLHPCFSRLCIVHLCSQHASAR